MQSPFKFGEIYPPCVNMTSKFLTKFKQKKHWITATATATATATNKSSLAFGRTSAGNHVEFWGKSVKNLSNDPCNAKTHLKWIVNNIFPFQLVSVDF